MQNMVTARLSRAGYALIANRCASLGDVVTVTQDEFEVAQAAAQGAWDIVETAPAAEELRMAVDDGQSPAAIKEAPAEEFDVSNYKRAKTTVTERRAGAGRHAK